MSWSPLIAALILAVYIAAAGADTSRSSAVRAQFQKLQPCPVTRERTGPCPGWVVDHQIPLCAGGADALHNMQWQRADEAQVKDREERAYCASLKGGKR